jgi:hypothetical protein
MISAYALAALNQECAKLAGTTSGRNQQLNASAFSLGRLVDAGALDRHTAEERLFSGAKTNGYVSKDGASMARATLKSGLDAGVLQPRVLPNGVAGTTKSAPRSALPTDTLVLPAGKSGEKFVACEASNPPRVRNELPNRRHVYRRAGQPVRAKIKRMSGGFIDLYRVIHPETGEIGWQAKKPRGYVVTPYVGAVNPFTDMMTSAAIFCPEGEKDVDTLGQHGLPAFTFGGSSDVPEKCEEFVQGRDVVVLADNDEPGRRWADKISSLFATTAMKLRVVHFPELPEGGDVSDWFEGGGTVAALLERVEKQPGYAPAPGEGPLPLFPPIMSAEPYPTDSLGPLADAARAIASQVQAPDSIAGQSVLAIASLAAQAIADVILPIGSTGQARPLSLYLVTIAASGDRKTSADNEALRPVRLREKTLREIYDLEHEIWRIAQTAWKSQCRSIEGKKGLDLQERRIELSALGAEPPEPIRPILTAPDPTVEGLARAWPTLPGSLGLITSEGGQMTGGYGFGPDHRLKTAATLSTLWDGGGLRRIRSVDGVTDLRGRRLALHLMVQPDAAAGILSDPVLRDQGLLSRVLVAAPDSIAGARLYRDPSPEDDLAISRYTATMLRLLEINWPCEADRSNELSPRQLRLGVQARQMWIEFHDRVEVETRQDGSLAELKDVAGKAAEQAARIAGVLAIVEDPTADEIQASSMKNALELVTWHLNEALRLAKTARLSPKLRNAHFLLEWLKRTSKKTITLREVQQFGPGRLREKDTITAAVDVLRDHGWLADDPTRKKCWLVVSGGKS